MKNSRVEFEMALVADRVANRFALDFGTPEALREYLREHPNADPKKHHVTRDDGGHKSRGDLKVKVKVPKDLAGEIGEAWKGQGESGNVVDRVKGLIEKGDDVPLKVLNSAIMALKTKIQYGNASSEQKTKMKGLSRKLKDLAQVKD